MLREKKYPHHHASGPSGHTHSSYHDRHTRTDCFFFFSVSSLQAIKHHHTSPGTISGKHYHHIKLLLGGITDLLETRRSAGLRTTLHTTRARTNIRGNDLADVAAKLVVTHFDTLPPSHTLRVDIGDTTPRPTHWVMYTAKPQSPIPACSTGTDCATLRRP